MASGTNGIATKQDLWNLTGISSHQVSNPTKCFVLSTDTSDTDLFNATFGFTLSPQASNSYSSDQCIKFSDIYFLDKPSTTYTSTNINTTSGILVVSFKKINYTGNHQWFNQSLNLTVPSNASLAALNASGNMIGSANAGYASVSKDVMSVGFGLQSLVSFLSQAKKLIFSVSGIYYSTVYQYAIQLATSQVTINWPIGS